MRKTASRILACILVLCCLAACNQTGQPSKIAETRTSPHGQGLQPDTYGIWPTQEFRTATPESQGVDSNAILQRLEKAEKKGELPNSYLVMRNGYLISETYFHGYDKDTAHTQYSVTKSVVSALVGIAIEEGFITGVDQKVADFFPEVTLTPELQYKKEMTVEHLLTMTSGVWGDDKWGELESAESMGAALFALKQEKEPGEKFRYDSMATNLLAILVSRAVGENLYTYAKEKLFDPLGMDSVVWGENEQGETFGGYGISMTPRDMLRFGYLYLNYGRWEDKQIVPADWVAQSPPQLEQNGAYGRLFWANEDNPALGYEAAGMYGQYIAIFPSLDMVIVVTNSDYKNREILFDDIQQGLQAAPLAENAQAQQKLKEMGDHAAQQPSYSELQSKLAVKTTTSIQLNTLKPTEGSPASAYTQTQQGWLLKGENWPGVETQETFQYPLMVTATYVPQENSSVVLCFRDGDMGINHAQNGPGLWTRDFCTGGFGADYINRNVSKGGQAVTVQWLLTDAFQAVTVNGEVLLYNTDNAYFDRASQSKRQKKSQVQLAIGSGEAVIQSLTISQLQESGV